MKKVLGLLAITLSLVSCAVKQQVTHQEPIKTQKTIHTRISIHNRLYAEAEIGQDTTTFFFRCEQFRNITIVKPIQLTPHDTEKLYRALAFTKGKKGQNVDIPTLDNKLVHIEYCRYMFKTYAIFDIIDKENDAIFHIFCLPKVQLDRLFNKDEIDFI
jgi:hypothetical protein